MTAVFRRGGDRTADAPYRVDHADGSTTVSVDQTGAFAGDLELASLGSHRFEAGTAGSVTLSNDGGSGAYIADAVLFTPDSGPVIENTLYGPLFPQADDPVTVTARVTDNTAVTSVRILWVTEIGGGSGSAEALDGGVSPDRAAGDSTFSTTLPGFPEGEVVTLTAEATDEFGGVTTGDPVEFEVGLDSDWDLVINEVLPSNGLSGNDPDFDDNADWVEIVNLGPDTADLSVVALSDTLTDPLRWRFPVGTALGAGERLVVWCDATDTVGQAIHTDFRLDADGEQVVLSDTSTGTVLDLVTFPALETDTALARIPDITGEFTQTIFPTVGAENLLGVRGDAPVFSVDSGLYTQPVQVAITAPGAEEIRITSDGSTPDESSALYTGPLTYAQTTGLRARLLSRRNRAQPGHFRLVLLREPRDRRP